MYMEQLQVYLLAYSLTYPRNRCRFSISLWNRLKTERSQPSTEEFWALPRARPETAREKPPASRVLPSLYRAITHFCKIIQSKSIISNISKWKPPISLSVVSLCRIKQTIQIYPIPFSRPGTVRIVVSPLTG